LVAFGGAAVVSGAGGSVAGGGAGVVSGAAAVVGAATVALTVAAVVAGAAVVTTAGAAVGAGAVVVAGAAGVTVVAGAGGLLLPHALRPTMAATSNAAPARRGRTIIENPFRHHRSVWGDEPNVSQAYLRRTAMRSKFLDL
jgi:hypothetical protein